MSSAKSARAKRLRVWLYRAHRAGDQPCTKRGIGFGSTTQSLELDLILESEFFERNQSQVVGCRTMPRNAENFALKLFRPFNFGLNPKRHRRQVRYRTHRDQRRALKNRADHGITGAGNDLDFSAHHRLNGNASCADIEQLTAQSILLKDAGFFGNSKSGKNRTDRRIGDSHAWQWGRRSSPPSRWRRQPGQTKDEQ